MSDLSLDKQIAKIRKEYDNKVKKIRKKMDKINNKGVKKDTISKKKKKRKPKVDKKTYYDMDELLDDLMYAKNSCDMNIEKLIRKSNKETEEIDIGFDILSVNPCGSSSKDVDVDFGALNINPVGGKFNFNMKNHLCIVSKNTKKYYKNVKGTWKRITKKEGLKAEKNKYRGGAMSKIQNPEDLFNDPSKIPHGAFDPLVQHLSWVDLRKLQSQVNNSIINEEIKKHERDAKKVLGLSPDSTIKQIWEKLQGNQEWPPPVKFRKLKNVGLSPPEIMNSIEQGDYERLKELLEVYYDFGISISNVVYISFGPRMEDILDIDPSVYVKIFDLLEEYGIQFVYKDEEYPDLIRFNSWIINLNNLDFDFDEMENIIKYRGWTAIFKRLVKYFGNDFFTGVKLGDKVNQQYQQDNNMNETFNINDNIRLTDDYRPGNFTDEGWEEIVGYSNEIADILDKWNKSYSMPSMYDQFSGIGVNLTPP